MFLLNPDVGISNSIRLQVCCKGGKGAVASGAGLVKRR